jgi:hypothetical protein
MDTKPGFSIPSLINKVVTKFAKKQTREVEPKITIDCRNPWQHNLERLSKCTFAAEPTARTPEMTEFVNNLESVAQEVKVTRQGIPAASPTQPQKPATAAEEEDNRLAKRAGDRTVQNMRAWWKDALNSDSPIVNADIPGKPRLLKRWFE